MHELYELKDKLTKELEEYGSQEMSSGSLEVIDKLAHAIKNICKIIESSEDEEYSERGSYRMSRNRGRYDWGKNYTRDGSYARGQRRNAMGRYSRTDGMEGLVEDIRGMMQELPQNIQQDAQRFVQKLEQSM